MAKKHLSRNYKNYQRSLALALALFGCVSLTVLAQSGRQRPVPPTDPTASQPVKKPRSTESSVEKPLPTPTPAMTTAISLAVDDDDIIRVNSNLVAIPASVVSKSGKPLSGLKLEDFTLLVDGTPATLSEVNFAETPVRLVMLFDNSSSQTAARDLEKKAALKFFKRVLRPVDQAALIAVETEPYLVRNMTGDVGALVKAVEDFGKPQGATALFDAVALAADYLKVFDGRRVIVIVSDGEDTISGTNFDDALNLAQKFDCQIYAVQTGHIENANLRQLAGERRLEEFTAQTGGAVHTPVAVSDLDQAFSQIAADLAQQYILSYYPPSDEPRDGRFRALTLSVKSDGQARVRTRKGYYATPRRAK